MAIGDEFFDATARSIRDRNVASSITSPQHLNSLRTAASLEPAENTPEIVVVSISDVSTLKRNSPPPMVKRGEEAMATPRGTREVKADLSSEGGQSNPGQLNPNATANTGAVSKAPAASAALPSQPTESATESPTTHAKPLPGPTSDAWWFSIANLTQDRPIVELSRRIISHFPSIAPASLMIASADTELSTNRSTARIAACVARLTGCRALLVDANWDGNMGRVQQSSGPSSGLAEIIADGRDWRESVIETQEARLFVLPCGFSEVPQRNIGNDTLVSLNSQWQREFNYVFINAGHVKQLIARRFAMCCDGTYVLVGLHQTTKRDAQAAMRVLVENHARVLGAIVFDAIPRD